MTAKEDIALAIKMTADKIKRYENECRSLEIQKEVKEGQIEVLYDNLRELKSIQEKIKPSSTDE